MSTILRLPIRLVCGALVCLVVIGAAYAWRRYGSNTAAVKAISWRAPLAGPSTMLWAWERPEDLSYINTQTTGVAFLARTITLTGDRVSAKPRLQPIQLSPDATVIPVVRIEVDRKSRPTLSASQLAETHTQITSVIKTSRIKAIQIDFDATVSQRPFYKSLLTRLRQSLPPEIKLSITALGSWCEGDRWIDELPIDEAVPMLFRMGVDRNSILSSLSSGGLASNRCRNVAGISIDEPLQSSPPVARLYVFNPEPWTPNSVKTLLETHQR